MNAVSSKRIPAAAVPYTVLERPAKNAGRGLDLRLGYSYIIRLRPTLAREASSLESG
jgi:hypothetical protein